MRATVTCALPVGQWQWASGSAGEPPLHQHTTVNTPASTRIAAAALTHKDLKRFELFSSFEVRKFRGDPYTLRSLPWPVRMIAPLRTM